MIDRWTEKVKEPSGPSDWWREEFVEPIERAGYRVSEEFKSAISGGMDPVVIFHKGVRGAGRQAAKGVAQELRGEVDYIFDQKLSPFTDRLDQLTQKRIEQAKKAGEMIISDAATSFSRLMEEGREHIEEVLTGVVDPIVKNNLRLAFALVNQARAEAILALRGLLNEVDLVLERHITAIFTMVTELLTQLRTLAAELIKEVRTELIDPAFEKLDRLETKMFEDIVVVIDKLGQIQGDVNAQIETFRKRVTTLLLPFGKNWSCYKRLGYDLQLGPGLTDIQVHRLSECLTLTEIEEEITSISVKDVADKYAQLQADAWLLACKHRNASAASGEYLRDWTKYGHLAELWRPYQ